MPSIVRATIVDAIQTATKLTKALDVDKNGEVSRQEIDRIKVIDKFVARNLLRTAEYAATYPHDLVPTPKMLQSELKAALSSLEKHDKNADGVFTEAEQKTASKVAKALVAFALQHTGKTVAEFKIKPYEKPGSQAWVALCQDAYYSAKSDRGPPRFGTALILARSEMPSAVRKRYDAFAKTATGKVQATSLKVNGATVYFFHALTQVGGEARLVNASGKVLSKGELAAQGSPPSYYDAPWTISWA